jgi:hypothetical protein
VSPGRPPQLGSVVWAELEDANGVRKVRPAVVNRQTAIKAAVYWARHGEMCPSMQWVRGL